MPAVQHRPRGVQQLLPCGDGTVIEAARPDGIGQVPVGIDVVEADDERPVARSRPQLTQSPPARAIGPGRHRNLDLLVIHPQPAGALATVDVRYPVAVHRRKAGEPEGRQQDTATPYRYPRAQGNPGMDGGGEGYRMDLSHLDPVRCAVDARAVDLPESMGNPRANLRVKQYPAQRLGRKIMYRYQRIPGRLSGWQRAEKRGPFGGAVQQLAEKNKSPAVLRIEQQPHGV